MTLQEAAQTALDVQDACNLSGVVFAFSRILTEVLWPEAHSTGKGTDWVNTHPISVLFADKIAHLTGIQFDDKPVFDAYESCRTLAEG